MKKFTVAIVGLLFLAVGIFLYIRNNNLTKNCTKEVDAIVVDMKQEFNTDSESSSTYMYYPILEYKANDEIIRATMDSGSSRPEYEINAKITILYNPDKPKQFIVKGDKSTSIMSYVFMGFGLALTGYGVVVIFKKEKEE